MKESFRFKFREVLLLPALQELVDGSPKKLPGETRVLVPGPDTGVLVLVPGLDEFGWLAPPLVLGEDGLEVGDEAGGVCPPGSSESLPRG